MAGYRQILGLILFFIIGCGAATTSLAADDILSKYKTSVAENDPALPWVAIVTTGGTIAMKTSAAAGGAVPSVSGTDLIDAVPSLKKMANIRVVNFSNIDSSQMTPELWLNLSKVVTALLADATIKGVIVTHGTDTMAEGAFFVDLVTKNGKPIVFTGAMRDASSPDPDGPGNLEDAVVQALSEHAVGWGTTVTLNQYVNAAMWVGKKQTTNVQTFESGEKGYLGYINEGKVFVINEPHGDLDFPFPETLPRVDIIMDYAGADGGHVRYAADQGAKGIILVGVGVGQVNAQVYEGVLYALKKGVKVVLTTRVPNGRVYPIYADPGGGATLKKAGVLMGGHFHAPKARLMLMVALGNNITDQEKLQGYFNNN